MLNLVLDQVNIKMIAKLETANMVQVVLVLIAETLNVVHMKNVARIHQKNQNVYEHKKYIQFF